MILAGVTAFIFLHEYNFGMMFGWSVAYGMSQNVTYKFDCEQNHTDLQLRIKNIVILIVAFRHIIVDVISVFDVLYLTGFRFFCCVWFVLLILHMYCMLTV